MIPILTAMTAMYNSSAPTANGGNYSQEMPVHMHTETLGPQHMLQHQKASSLEENSQQPKVTPKHEKIQVKLHFSHLAVSFPRDNTWILS